MKTGEVLQAWAGILAGHRPSLSIEITKECPLRCPGCYAFDAAHLGGDTELRQLSDFKGGWIQGPSATGVILADQCWTKSKAPSGRKSSAGAFHPRVFLGRVLSRQAMSSSWSCENSERSVPLGRYWRSRPLVFSQMPRSQGAWGWAK